MYLTTGKYAISQNTSRVQGYTRNKMEVEISIRYIDYK